MKFMDPGMDPGMASAPRRDWKRALPYLGILGIFAVVFASLIAFRLVPVLDGHLMGPDSYMHMVRATHLHDTGGWFDISIPRSNAPYGEVLNWTRPFDVLLLLGAALLSPVLGFKAGLFWAGALSGPVLLMITALALAWAAKPFLSRELRCLAMALVLAQPAVMVYSFPGRADHHGLIYLTFIVVVGLMVRMIGRPYNHGLALAAGAVLGAGLWFSTELLLVLAVAFAAMSVNWILAGGDGARKNLAAAFGLTMMVLMALVIERPPGEYLAEEYDRISVVHFFIALVALGFWAVVRLSEQRGKGTGSVSGRIAMAACGAVAASALVFVVYPKLFAGPMVDFDPRVVEIWASSVNEMKPLFPVDAISSGKFLFYLGPSLVCVPFLLWVLISGRNQPQWWSWLYVGLTLGVYLPLAILHFRFAPFAELLLIVVLVEFVGRFQRWFQWNTDRLSGQLARGMIIAVLLAGWIGVGISVTAVTKSMKQPAVAGDRPPAVERCPKGRIASYLDSGRWRGDPRIILASVPSGPELLYRTRHKVVGTPFHRNAAGMVDVHNSFASADPQVAQRVVQRRGVGLILLCPVQAMLDFFHQNHGDDAFYLQLAGGRVPPWLRLVELPGQMGNFRLFEVIRPRPGSAS